MRNTAGLSFAIKGLLFAVILCSFVFGFTVDSYSKVIRKTSVPAWATKKHELYFSDINLSQILSLMIPNNVSVNIDMHASDILVTVKGKFSIEEILNKYKDKIEYEFSDNVLHIRGYLIKKYEIPYLSAIYNATQSYNSTGGYYLSSGSVSTTTAGGVSTTEKTASIEYKTSIDFWNEIKAELKELIGAVDVLDVSTQSAQPTPATLSRPLDSASFLKSPPSTVTTGVSSPVTSKPKSFVTINRASGLVVVGGTVDKIRKVDAYIEGIKKKLTESVEIDFTLISVRDTNSVKTGLNWQTVLKNVLLKTSRGIMDENDVQIINYSPSTGSISLIGKTRQAFDDSGADKQNVVIEALKRVADVKVVSKTNLLLKNNTTVGFNSGTITTFIDSLQSTSVASGSSTTASYTVTKGSVLSGIDMVISANIDGENITLSVIPTISTLVDLEKIEFGDNLVVQNPTIESKKSVVTVTVKNGETTAIVGYNLNNKSYQRDGLPILGDIPVIGLLFSRSNVVDENVSFVMLLTPKIKRI